MRNRIKAKLLSILFVALVMITFAGDLFSQTSSCNYYASPTGGGNGLSASSPFKIRDFWKVAGPGKTLCLLDGVYSDSRSMIAPPLNLNGTASARISIKALNEGRVRINGGGVLKPVTLTNNDWFILEGFDAYNCAIACIHLYTGADNNIVRRVVAWDAGPDNGNSEIFGVHGNTGNLLEDVAGFGKARKIFQNSFRGNNVTIRRAWGRFEYNAMRTVNGMVYSIAYNSYNATYENVLATWNEQPHYVGHRYGLLAMDRLDGPNHCANSRYLGSIAYTLSTDRIGTWLGSLESSNDAYCFDYKDIVVYIDPSHSTLRPAYLRNDPNGGSPGNKKVTRFTQIGGTTSTIQSQWSITQHMDVSTLGSTNIWTGANQANVCKRYINGVLTNKPLWPWPMNQRIINAMTAAGKSPVDVTKTMEQISGPIPSLCRSNSNTSLVLTAPEAPEDLVTEQVSDR